MFVEKIIIQIVIIWLELICERSRPVLFFKGSILFTFLIHFTYFIYLFIYLLSFFLGLLLWHMEIPRLGVQSEP